METASRLAFEQSERSRFVAEAAADAERAREVAETAFPQVLFALNHCLP